MILQYSLQNPSDIKINHIIGASFPSNQTKLYQLRKFSNLFNHHNQQNKEE
jgi:hypothetical protein